MANETISEVKGIGTVQVRTSEGNLVSVTGVRYVPSFSRNLFSLGTFDDQGCTFSCESGILKVRKSCRTVMKAKKHGKLYFLQGNTFTGEPNAVVKADETNMWHSRLGHVSQKSLDMMVRKGYLDETNVSTIQFCESCIFGKAHKVSFSTSVNSSKNYLEYVHANLWGSPSVPHSLANCHYFLSLVDDFSRKEWVYFTKTKDQAFEKFVEWKLLVENQSGLKVKKLRTDNGLELCNREFDGCCSESGIARHMTIAHTPQQNGLVERMNRTILERVRSILSESGLPKVFWAEAVNTSVHLINRMPSTAIEGKIPEEVWSKIVPGFSHLRWLHMLLSHR